MFSFISLDIISFTSFTVFIEINLKSPCSEPKVLVFSGSVFVDCFCFFSEPYFPVSSHALSFVENSVCF